MLDKKLWSKRLQKEKLRLLYKQNAEDFVDTDLLQDVALTLYMRCKDIIAVSDARDGKVRCPLCYFHGIETYIAMPSLPFHEREEHILSCTVCGNNFTWEHFCKNYINKNM
jgi:hypothetical protein